MSCEICGKGGCIKSFHSFQEQEEFDTKTGRYSPDKEKIDELESENARLREIIERAKSYCEKYIEWLNYKTVIEILNEADKREI